MSINDTMCWNALDTAWFKYAVKSTSKNLFNSVNNLSSNVYVYKPLVIRCSGTPKSILIFHGPLNGTEDP